MTFSHDTNASDVVVVVILDIFYKTVMEMRTFDQLSSSHFAQDCNRSPFVQLQIKLCPLLKNTEQKGGAQK